MSFASFINDTAQSTYNTDFSLSLTSPQRETTFGGSRNRDSTSILQQSRSQGPLARGSKRILEHITSILISFHFPPSFTHPLPGIINMRELYLKDQQLMIYEHCDRNTVNHKTINKRMPCGQGFILDVNKSMNGSF